MAGGNRWTTDEDARLRRAYPTADPTRLIKLFPRHPTMSSINSRACKLGLSKKKRPGGPRVNVSDDRRLEEWFRRYRAGLVPKVMLDGT